MTLSELRTRMTDVELIGWHTYYTIVAAEEEAAYEKAKRSRR